MRHLARIEWALCDNEIDGSRIVNHLGDNNHNAPCDMLQRLGVMDVGIVVANWPLNHHFPAGWSPLEAIALHRHAGEPTAHDLWLGLTFWIHWFHEDANLEHREQPATIDANFSVLGNVTAEWKRYRIWAIQGACQLLHAAGLGDWKAGGRFRTEPHTNVDSVEAYWSSATEMAARLGGRDRLYAHLSGS